MLLRIVNMEFDPVRAEAFEDLIARTQTGIEAMPGCHQVRLLKGYDDKPTSTTLSWWVHESDLQAYRGSQLFGEVWPKTKAMFSGPPVAWFSDWSIDEPIPGGAE